MRLIDADKMKSVLEELQEHSIDGKMNIESALYLLSIQNTAYDIDKVVEEIKDNYGCGNCEQSILIGCNDCWESEMLDGILEIVKAGGKNGNE